MHYNIMHIYYYYHIPKTGGTSILNFLIYLNNNLSNSKLYNFNDLRYCKTYHPKNIDFNDILSYNNINQYDYIFIHHHQGYYGLMHYKDILIEKKKELENNGHIINIFTTIRDILPFNNSRLNFLNKCGIKVSKNEILSQELHYNILTKYLFYGYHGLWQIGDYTPDKINNTLTEKNILEISKVIDNFIKTEDISMFIDKISKSLNIIYPNSEKIYNKNNINITFNDSVIELLNNNKLDSFLLQTYDN